MRLGTSTKHLRYAPISPEMAVKLAVVTGSRLATLLAERTWILLKRILLW
ncbi:hypothetical protein HMPREF0294_0748 [Corynebacterium glucuronolyticum ATCC 51867]|nr:hypothetical protein HMPREF0294_0748 [Corynebacterium glucuronolyticum ATCC 51867]